MATTVVFLLFQLPTSNQASKRENYENFGKFLKYKSLKISGEFEVRKQREKFSVRKSISWKTASHKTFSIMYTISGLKN